MMVTSSSNWRLMNFSVFNLAGLEPAFFGVLDVFLAKISKNFLARPERVLLEERAKMFVPSMFSTCSALRN